MRGRLLRRSEHFLHGTTAHRSDNAFHGTQVPRTEGEGLPGCENGLHQGVSSQPPGFLEQSGLIRCRPNSERATESSVKQPPAPGNPEASWG